MASAGFASEPWPECVSDSRLQSRPIALRYAYRVAARSPGQCAEIDPSQSGAATVIEKGGRVRGVNRQIVLEGIERAPEGLGRLYHGDHNGKLVVRVSEMPLTAGGVKARTSSGASRGITLETGVGSIGLRLQIPYECLVRTLVTRDTRPAASPPHARRQNDGRVRTLAVRPPRHLRDCPL
jgi:hypothetical protein